MHIDSTTQRRQRADTDIHEYANLVAGVLGTDIAALEGEARIRACHALLQKHPYAYPLALELSLHLPDAMAITWLRKICEAYYVRPDVQEEIDAFQVWRMSQGQALHVAIRHAESMGYFLPGVMAYLEEYHPLLAKYVAQKRQWDEQEVLSLRGRIDGAVQACFCILGRLLKGMPSLRARAVRAYLRLDVPAPSNLWARYTACFLMRIFSAKVTSRASATFQAHWWDIPMLDDTRYHARQDSKSPMGSIDIVTVLWGEEYIRCFSLYNARSLLAEENLPYLAQHMDVRLVFYTTRRGMADLQSRSVYAELCKYAPVRFVFIDTVIKDIAPELDTVHFTAKYSGLTASHNHALRQAAQNKRRIFFNISDIILQCNALKIIFSMMQQGKTNIFAYSGPYSCLEDVEAKLAQQASSRALCLDNRAMRDLSHSCRHPSSALYYETSPMRYFGAIIRHFDVKNEGLIVHSGCQVPVVLSPCDKVAVRATIDDDYPLSPRTTPESIKIIRDNRVWAVASLDPLEAHNNALRWPPYDRKSFAKDFRAGMRLWNRIFFTLPCSYYQTDTPRDDVWCNVQSHAMDDATQILCDAAHVIPIPPVELFLHGILSFLQQYIDSQKEEDICTL